MKKKSLFCIKQSVNKWQMKASKQWKTARRECYLTTSQCTCMKPYAPSIKHYLHLFCPAARADATLDIFFMVRHTIFAKTSAQVTWTLDLLASLAVCEDLCALARADIFDCKCLWICVMLILNTCIRRNPRKEGNIWMFSLSIIYQRGLSWRPS